MGSGYNISGRYNYIRFLFIGYIIDNEDLQKDAPAAMAAGRLPLVCLGAMDELRTADWDTHERRC